jgi:hypothetical protein
LFAHILREGALVTDSFTSKAIELRLTLGTGTFGAQKGNTKLVRGLRVDCQIEKNGHPSKNRAMLKVYGMLKDDMDTLNATPYGTLKVRKDLIQVSAGTANLPLDVVFEGEMTERWAVYKSPPNLYFHIVALAGFYPAITPATPKSYTGSTDVRSIMGGLASQMGYTFEDNGVNVKLSDPYLHGTPMDQASHVADAANIEFGVDDGTLFIAPRGAARKGEVPLISKDTGMVEYPTFGKKGIEIRTLLIPNIKLGGVVEVKSSINIANGLWRVVRLHHQLDSETPNGKWFTRIWGTKVGA